MIEWDKRGVRVNEFLQSVSNPAVYAAGDAAASGGPPLSPVASYEGRLVAANLLKGNHQTANYLGVPSVVFTIPPLAAVGLSERAAHEQNLKFRVKMERTSNLYSSRRIAETHSGYKVLVEEGTDRILGAHILGSGAGRSHQSVRRCHSLRDACDRIKTHFVCLSDERLNGDAHALERRWIKWCSGNQEFRLNLLSIPN